MEIPKRNHCFLLIAVALIVSGVVLGGCNKMDIVAWYMGLPDPQYKVKFVEGVQVPMRDGVKLAADLYLPDKEGTYPVVLIRTMYGRQSKLLPPKGGSFDFGCKPTKGLRPS